MLTPSARVSAFLALADPPHRLAAVVLAVSTGRGTTPASRPSPSPGPSGGVVRWWVTDPAGAERRLLADLHAAVSEWWATWHRPLLALAVLLMVARVGLAAWRARSWRRAREAGAWLALVPPSIATSGQGEVLWEGLVGLIRPGRLGRHVRLIGWEVHSDGQRLAAGLWLPATVEAGQVARTVTAAYSRARVRTGACGRRAAPTGLAPLRPARATLWSRLWPVPVGLVGRGGAAVRRRERGPVSVGYLVVPTVMWAPLLSDPRPTGRGRDGARDGTGDGLRMAYSALASTPAGYRAVLQILARPQPAGTARAARRVRRAGGGPPGPGMPARTLLAVLDLAQAGVRAGLDLAVPGPSMTRTATARHAPVSGAGVDAVTAQRHRDALTKASAELVEVCVRVAVSGPNRGVCRATAFEIVNALQVPAAQRLHALRLPHAQATAAGRGRGNWRAVGPICVGRGHRRGWFVATAAEVGALARFPHQPALYRFDTATAPHLPAPTGIPVLPYPDHDHEQAHPGHGHDEYGHDEYDGEVA
jgi:hypothetical protein